LATCDFFSPASSGGIERVAVKVLERLRSWGAEVRVLTALPRHMQPFEVGDGVQVDVVRLADLSAAARAQVGFAPGVIRAASRAARDFQPDVFFVNGIHFQTSVAAALVQPRIGAPLVTSSHVAGLQYMPQPTRALTAAYERLLGRLILRRSTRVISISGSVTEHLHELGVPDSKIDLVPNGVDLEQFRPALETPAGARVRLMFVGRHIANKGPQVFLEALVLLHRAGVPFEAVFLSDGPLRPRLQARVRETGLDGSVRFLGHVPDVAAEMRQAQVIARPSFTEGMPLTMLEAMASGVALVVSEIPGNTDLLEDGRNGLLVPAGDAPSLAAALRRMIEEPELRRRLVAGGLQTAAQYSWDACAEGTAGSLLRAIAESRG
jgi:glycosyltransferase involved in cell wall biosynthesis